MKRIYISGQWIEPPIIFEVNIDQKVNIGQISEILNFHPIDLNLKRIYISGQWIEPPIIFELNIDQKLEGAGNLLGTAGPVRSPRSHAIKTQEV